MSAIRIASFESNASVDSAAWWQGVMEDARRLRAYLENRTTPYIDLAEDRDGTAITIRIHPSGLREVLDG